MPALDSFAQVFQSELDRVGRALARRMCATNVLPCGQLVAYVLLVPRCVK